MVGPRGCLRIHNETPNMSEATLVRNTIIQTRRSNVVSIWYESRSNIALWLADAQMPSLHDMEQGVKGFELRLEAWPSGALRGSVADLFRELGEVKVPQKSNMSSS